LHEGALKAIKSKLDLQKMFGEYLNLQEAHKNSYSTKWEKEVNGGRPFWFTDTPASKQKKAEIVRLSEDTGVLCPFTAFFGTSSQKVSGNWRKVDVAVSSEITPLNDPRNDPKKGNGAPEKIQQAPVESTVYELDQILNQAVKCTADDYYENEKHGTTITQSCGYWTHDDFVNNFESYSKKSSQNFVPGMKQDFSKLVRMASKNGKIDNCKKGSHAKIASTLLHLAYIHNKFSTSKVFYRLPTKNAMIYIQEQNCQSVHKLVTESLKIYKKWNKKDANKNEFYRQKFRLPCENEDAYGECETVGKPVDAMDILADNYQAITSAQNVKTHLWDFEFLEKSFGIKKADFRAVENICSKLKIRKQRAKKIKECKKGIPTYVAIGLLYGKFMKDIDDLVPIDDKRKFNNNERIIKLILDIMKDL
jgi:hypothetical protein